MEFCPGIDCVRFVGEAVVTFCGTCVVFVKEVVEFRSWVNCVVFVSEAVLKLCVGTVLTCVEFISEAVVT